MPASVEESIVDIFHALTFLDKLQTTRPSKLVSVVLSPPSDLENGWIRDAAEHELGLYTQRHGVDGADGDDNELHHAGAGARVASRQDMDAERVNKLRRSLLGRSANGRTSNRTTGAWTFKQRPAPHAASMPPQATPLRKRKPTGGETATRGQPQHAEMDAQVYLVAAQKLLVHYPSAGSTEHIKLLSSQYEGLVESIADLEESLQKQQQKRSAISTTNTKSSQATSSLGAVSADIVQLEQDIKREELEILALQSQFAEQSAKKARSPAKTAVSKAAVAPTDTARRRKLSIPNKAEAAVKSHAKAQAKPARSSIADSIVALKRSQGRSSVPTPRNDDSSESASVVPAAASPARSKLTPAAESSTSTSRPTVQPPSLGVEAAQPKAAVSDAQLAVLTGKMKAVLPASATDGVLTAWDLAAKLEELSQASGSTDSPSLVLEYSLLHIYVSLLLGRPSASASASELTLILRPTSSSTSDSNPGEQDAMLSMSSLKTALGKLAVNAGWAEDMGTKAIYGLVAKRVLRIDRRGREALVAFT